MIISCSWHFSCLTLVMTFFIYFSCAAMRLLSIVGFVLLLLASSTFDFGGPLWVTRLGWKDGDHGAVESLSRRLLSSKDCSHLTRVCQDDALFTMCILSGFVVASNQDFVI